MLMGLCYHEKTPVYTFFVVYYVVFKCVNNEFSKKCWNKTKI